jgi:hypothetical protein
LRKAWTGGALTGLLLLGAACGPAPGTADAANASAQADAAAANASVPEPAAPTVVLEGAGLRIPGASPPQAVAFDTPKAATVAALTQALGRPPSERGADEECGGGGLEYAGWKDEIMVWFEDGRFAGWSNKGKLKTAEGVGVGSSRAEAARLPGFEVEETSLGTEFRAGGLSGLLDSKAPDARVTDLWGGATCVFR